MFKETHPIIGTRDIRRAIEFYTRQLGFKFAFGDTSGPPNYVGFRRDAVELHMQFQHDYEMSTIRLRFLVEDPDALFEEYRIGGSSVLLREFTIRHGERANSLSTTWIATRSRFTAI